MEFKIEVKKSEDKDISKFSFLDTLTCVGSIIGVLTPIAYACAHGPHSLSRASGADLFHFKKCSARI